jgi:hypothetical protein
MADKDSESEAPLTASTGNQATQAASSATEAADAAKAAAVETALIVYHLFEDPLYFDDLEGPVTDRDFIPCTPKLHTASLATCGCESISARIETVHDKAILCAKFA